jgi:hypothetical protein
MKGDDMMRRWAIAVILGLVVVAVGYFYDHTQFGISQPCRRNSTGDIVCPPPYTGVALADGVANEMAALIPRTR